MVLLVDYSKRRATTADVQDPNANLNLKYHKHGKQADRTLEEKIKAAQLAAEKETADADDDTANQGNEMPSLLSTFGLNNSRISRGGRGGGAVEKVPPQEKLPQKETLWKPPEVTTPTTSSGGRVSRSSRGASSRQLAEPKVENDKPSLALSQTPEPPQETLKAKETLNEQE